jgi:hypothetical protein
MPESLEFLVVLRFSECLFISAWLARIVNFNVKLIQQKIKILK